jgi:hypothetical protein
VDVYTVKMQGNNAFNNRRVSQFAPIQGPLQNTTPTANHCLPSGIKRSAEVAQFGPPDNDEDDSSSDSSFDSEFVPSPRARSGGRGLREHPQTAPPRYWDDENHRAACLAELQELANAGVTWTDIDASEGDSDCEIKTEDGEDDEGEEGESETQEDPAP